MNELFDSLYHLFTDKYVGQIFATKINGRKTKVRCHKVIKDMSMKNRCGMCVFRKVADGKKCPACLETDRWDGNPVIYVEV